MSGAVTSENINTPNNPSENTPLLQVGTSKAATEVPRSHRSVWAKLTAVAVLGYLIYFIQTHYFSEYGGPRHPQPDLVLPPNETLYPSFPVDIASLFNNVAAGENADFDPHSHGGFAPEYLPTKEFVHDRVKVCVFARHFSI
jgi:hypothetical protein